MKAAFDSYRKELDSLHFSDEATRRLTARLKAAEQAEDAHAETGLDNATPGAVAQAMPPSGAPSSPAAAKIVELPLAGGNGAAPASQYDGARVARRPKHRMLRVAAAAAIVAGLTLGSTTAYGAMTQRTPAAVFSDIFGGAPARTEVIDKIGHPIGASVTSNGVTVTADAVIGDSSSLTIVFSIKRDDGKALMDPSKLKATDTEDETAAGRSNPQDKLLLGWNGTADMTIDGVSSTGGGYYFYDANPSDASIQFVWTCDNIATFDGQSVAGRTARVHLGDLVSYVNGFEQPQAVTSGTWNLKFELGYEDASVALQSGQKIDVNGMNAVVDKIAVSPVGASVSYTVDAVNSEPMPESGQADTLPTDKFTKLPFLVTFKDGSTVDATDGAAGMREQNGKTIVTKGMAFDRIVDVNDIASVTVGEQAVPVR